MKDEEWLAGAWRVLDLEHLADGFVRNHLPCRTAGVVERCRLWVEPHSSCCIEGWERKHSKLSAA